jgi:hypothetical protein
VPWLLQTLSWHKLTCGQFVYLTETTPNFQILKFVSFPERDNPNKRVFESAKMSVCMLSKSLKACLNELRI